MTLVNRCAVGEPYTLIAPYLRGASSVRSFSVATDRLTIHAHWPERGHFFTGAFQAGKLVWASEAVIVQGKFGKTFCSRIVNRADSLGPMTMTTVIGNKD